MCAKTMTLGNYAKWVYVLMHIHISAVGMLINVKVVSQLTCILLHVLVLFTL